MQYTSKVYYVPGDDNVVALSRIALSRIDAIEMPRDFELNELAKLQEADKELADIVKSPSKTFKLDRMVWGPDQTLVYLETSTGSLRPYIPAPLRRKIFNRFHRLSHPSGRAASKLISKRYFWPSMRKDIAHWARTCISCQQSKVSRHVNTVPDVIAPPDGRFHHVHLDIIGPLPTSEGFSYCMTAVDRFSRWLEAFPIRDISEDTVAKAFYAWMDL